jgi:hypothetical protein
MVLVRIEAGDQVALAVDDLVALGNRLDDLTVTATGPRTVSFEHGSDSWSATVVPVDSAGIVDVRGLIADETRASKVAVGNKISEDARRLLSDHGWSWLDRRIGADLVHRKSTLAIRFVPTSGHGAAVPTPMRADGPIRGRAGVSYAAALLLAPDDPPTMRAVAREVHMSPQSISNAAKLLADHGLVLDGRAALPDLFWALADVWRPVQTVSVAAAPDPEQPQLTTNTDDLSGPGWALGGDGAALASAAPVFTTDERLTFWVPSQTEARRAQRALGAAETNTRAATIAVPPTPLVVTRRVPGSPWPLAHPIFVALDLARDPGRGREILDQWHPEGVVRVWA